VTFLLTRISNGGAVSGADLGKSSIRLSHTQSSEDQLRQIGDDDIKRCQQLIPTRATRRVNARLGREALQLAVRKIKVRP